MSTRQSYTYGFDSSRYNLIVGNPFKIQGEPIMKKILSIVIAAAMLLAISVPAFAATATIDQSTSGGVGNSSVVTTEAE